MRYVFLCDQTYFCLKFVYQKEMDSIFYVYTFRTHALDMYFCAIKHSPLTLDVLCLKIKYSVSINFLKLITFDKNWFDFFDTLMTK